jgi:hypothetical protein
MGPLFFYEVLLMPKDGPIAYAAGAANGVAWAH